MANGRGHKAEKAEKAVKPYGKKTMWREIDEKVVFRSITEMYCSGRNVSE